MEESQKMVFIPWFFYTACDGDKLGTGFLIPFQNDEVTIYNFEKEAIELSYAEGMNGKVVAGTKDAWAVIGVILNKNIDDTEELLITKYWNDKLHKERYLDRNDFKLGSESTPLEHTGIMNIAWPTAVDPNYQERIDKFGSILATVTKPTDYPDNSIFLDSVKLDLSRKYFLNNLANGITTY